ncbi:MAG: L-seryl-tRNA(Sec) selenium transferase, partial [Planctomycetaceae bacterium]|nr:L-seryl-tRNA(Sec) selenium transferase [Planctomycetaceae bacterium]
MSPDRFRILPSVDEVLHDTRLSSLAIGVPRGLLVRWVRRAVDDLRARLAAESAPGADRNVRCSAVVAADRSAAVAAIVSDVLTAAQRDQGRRLRPVINATGVLLHTNLGRAPLARSAVQNMLNAAGYCNVEMNLHDGGRNKRGERVCELLAELTGAGDAVVVNNCAAATMLVLQTLAAGREVIVSRGQLVEIGGGFRLPEVFRAAGVTLKEVGTTNRTYLRDYESAVGENSAAIIRVHRSNFQQVGFVAEPGIDDLVSLGRSVGLPVVDDTGSGLIRSFPTGVSERSPQFSEPTVEESIRAGADLV